jgi:hypothetical protein
VGLQVQGYERMVKQTDGHTRPQGILMCLLYTGVGNNKDESGAASHGHCLRGADHTFLLCLQTD